MVKLSPDPFSSPAPEVSPDPSHTLYLSICTEILYERYDGRFCERVADIINVIKNLTKKERKNEKEKTVAIVAGGNSAAITDRSGIRKSARGQHYNIPQPYLDRIFTGVIVGTVLSMTVTVMTAYVLSKPQLLGRKESDTLPI